MVTLIDECCKGERLSRAPVDAGAAVDGLVTCLEYLGDLRVELARWWQNRDLVANISQGAEIDTCILLSSVAFRIFNLFPLVTRPILRVELEILGLLVNFFQMIRDHHIDI